MMEGGQNRRSMEGGWVSHWNPDSHPDSYPPTAVSCPGAGHMCQDPSAWHLGHCICTEPAAYHLLSSSREWPSCPPLLLDLPVGTHQTTCEIFFLLLSQHIVPRRAYWWSTLYFHLNHLVQFSQLFFIITPVKRILRHFYLIPPSTIKLLIPQIYCISV